jgi:YbbR domain-containing protein
LNDQNGSRHLFLLALAISVALWLMFDFSKRDEPQREKSFEVSVTYHVPQGFIILNPLQMVTVRVRGDRDAIDDLNPFRVDVDVVLDEEPGTKQIFLAPENVSVPRGIDVASVSPIRLDLELDELVSQRIALQVESRGEPAAGAIEEAWTVMPDSVLVTGPRTMLEGLSAIHVPVNLDGHAFSFEERVTLAPPDPLIQIVDPTAVNVHVVMQPPGPPQPASSGR